jgi:hypothetical protein
MFVVHTQNFALLDEKVLDKLSKIRYAANERSQKRKTSVSSY